METHSSLYILGAGGHGKVVMDAAFKSFPLRKIEIYDSCSDLIGKNFLNKWIIRDVSSLGKIFDLHVAIGDNKLREELAKKHIYDCTNLCSIIHPNSIIGSNSNISEGTFVAAGVIIAPNVILGYGVIINHMAIVDHECIIGDWTHIAPNVTLGGRVTVGKGVFVGAGAVVLPNIHIGDYAVVGAGAVVTKDIPPRKTVVGIPARSIIKK